MAAVSLYKLLNADTPTLASVPGYAHVWGQWAGTEAYTPHTKDKPKPRPFIITSLSIHSSPSIQDERANYHRYTSCCTNLCTEIQVYTCIHSDVHVPKYFRGLKNNYDHSFQLSQNMLYTHTFGRYFSRFLEGSYGKKTRKPLGEVSSASQHDAAGNPC